MPELPRLPKSPELKRWYLAFFVVVTALCGCQFDPYADWFITKDVPESSLVGSYHVTDDSVKHFATTEMPFLQAHHLPVSPGAKITLANSHKISVTQVPIDLGSSRPCIMDGDGNWEITKHSEYPAILVNLTNLKGSSGCPHGGSGFALELFDDSRLRTHAGSKYPMLHLTIGDPDSGDALQFEKD